MDFSRQSLNMYYCHPPAAMKFKECHSAMFFILFDPSDGYGANTILIDQIFLVHLIHFSNMGMHLSPFWYSKMQLKKSCNSDSRYIMQHPSNEFADIIFEWFHSMLSIFLFFSHPVTLIIMRHPGQPYGNLCCINITIRSKKITPASKLQPSRIVVKSATTDDEKTLSLEIFIFNNVNCFHVNEQKMIRFGVSSDIDHGICDDHGCEQDVSVHCDTLGVVVGSWRRQGWSKIFISVLKGFKYHLMMWFLFLDGPKYDLCMSSLLFQKYSYHKLVWISWCLIWVWTMFHHFAVQVHKHLQGKFFLLLDRFFMFNSVIVPSREFSSVGRRLSPSASVFFAPSRWMSFAP